jgi:hypothetical protein
MLRAHSGIAERFMVEITEAAAILAGWGCDYLQGALVGLAAAERPWLDVRRVANSE